jgi:hypothetical protein
VEPVPVAAPPLAVGEREEEAELLSADNNSVPSTVDATARNLVRKLGMTPQEQARTLAAGLDHDELLALVEELHDHM